MVMQSNWRDYLKKTMSVKKGMKTRRALTQL